MADSPSPPPPGPAAERRAHPRHPCGAAVPIPYLARPSFRTDWASVRDLSASGAALLLGGPPDLGAVLLLRLGVPWSELAPLRLARVVRVGALEAGGWLIGCQFTRPLPPDELDDLRRLFGPTA